MFLSFQETSKTLHLYSFSIHHFIRGRKMPDKLKKSSQKEDGQLKRDKIIQKLVELDEFEEDVELFDSS